MQELIKTGPILKDTVDLTYVPANVFVVSKVQPVFPSTGPGEQDGLSNTLEAILTFFGSK